MLALQNAPAAEPGAAGADAARPRGRDRHREVRPDAQPVEGTGGLAGVLEYNTDLFDARDDRPHGRAISDAARRRWRREPDARGRLPLLSAGEREQLLVEWNATGRDCRRGRSTSWSRRRAARTPEAVAVIAGGVELTYGELDGGPTGSPTTCGASASARRCGWASASSARPSCWWRSSASQGGRRLRAARPRLPARAAGLDAGGLGARRC